MSHTIEVEGLRHHKHNVHIWLSIVWARMQLNSLNRKFKIFSWKEDLKVYVQMSQVKVGFNCFLKVSDMGQCVWKSIRWFTSLKWNNISLSFEMKNVWILTTNVKLISTATSIPLIVEEIESHLHTINRSEVTEYYSNNSEIYCNCFYIKSAVYKTCRDLYSLSCCVVYELRIMKLLNFWNTWSHIIQGK